MTATHVPHLNPETRTVVSSGAILPGIHGKATGLSKQLKAGTILQGAGDAVLC